MVRLSTAIVFAVPLVAALDRAVALDVDTHYPMFVHADCNTHAPKFNLKQKDSTKVMLTYRVEGTLPQCSFGACAAGPMTDPKSVISTPTRTAANDGVAFEVTSDETTGRFTACWSVTDYEKFRRNKKVWVHHSMHFEGMVHETLPGSQKADNTVQVQFNFRHTHGSLLAPHYDTYFTIHDADMLSNWFLKNKQYLGDVTTEEGRDKIVEEAFADAKPKKRARVEAAWRSFVKGEYDAPPKPTREEL